jgi:hypothetical protein
MSRHEHSSSRLTIFCLDPPKQTASKSENHLEDDTRTREGITTNHAVILCANGIF